MFLGNTDVADRLREVMQETYGDEKSSAKKAAIDSGGSPRAAENWLSGENPMGLTAFLNLYHNNPAFKAWARKLLLMEQDLDPRLEAEINTFVRTIQRIGAE